MYEIAARHEAVHARLSVASMKVADKRKPTPGEWQNFNDALGNLHQVFGHDLAAEYAADLPQEVQTALFEKAWSDRSKDGFHAVEREYAELAVYTRFVRNH